MTEPGCCLSADMENLLLLITNLGLGGAQRVFHDHSVALARHYRVTEAVFNLDDGNMFASDNELVSLDVGGGGGPVDKLRNFGRRVTRLKALKKRLSIAVSISHLEGADYVNLLSKGAEKVILCIHGSKLHDTNIVGPLGWLRKRVLMPALYNRADRIVTVSRDIGPELVAGFGVRPEKIVTINNFFDVARIEARSREPLPPAEAALYAAGPVLVTAGRLAAQKNQAPLLDVFAALLREQPSGPPPRLVFVGDGELRAELLAAARALGLRTYAAWETAAPLTPDFDVYFLGTQANPFQYLRPATAFVFPSAFEGFPMALGEALACGLPVLSADCPTGPREMLAPDAPTPAAPLRAAERGPFGVLLPMLTNPATLAADQAVWTAALAALLADAPARARLGAAGRRRMEDFTPERIFGQWVSLIEEVRRA